MVVVASFGNTVPRFVQSSSVQSNSFAGDHGFGSWPGVKESKPVGAFCFKLRRGRPSSSLTNRETMDAEEGGSGLNMLLCPVMPNFEKMQRAGFVYLRGRTCHGQVTIQVRRKYKTQF